ncbi:hypothetical protein VF14_30405 [Nostoc linckia z18]|uniref:Uncharacterized protein n=2 Tax=Nostoc linckia TaxID=92942 RepID=A0A9Q5Z460_NOSLI|nr:hypothetical protein VF02_30725 [Nostoc linckia z1]PHJ57828.1 hypothetical protein VF05_35150 [Nostoc linckia z3]PHJ64281.1 hypothetical protein VF03_29420 [Nostoc linckia z2]PHJ76052.1 hypothetical protein VF06_32280 [Nostoc linckia z4]PHJ81073.1 hypothetical protein VF04_37760 [Nostoc linckia z7]PHJ82773.1 hypothetical protein VF07_27960 [Nostoc linckia z6]PHJ90282.1 hypothetical protein VF08_37425 [Nostoc linckia z8]PHJ95682.1 hypothetical protein VF09_36605 [Nostoc linckia z9]PHK0850
MTFGILNFRFPIVQELAKMFFEYPFGAIMFQFVWFLRRVQSPFLQVLWVLFQLHLTLNYPPLSTM